MSKKIHDGTPNRISFDPGSLDVAALDEIAEGQDISRAELIRRTLKDLVAQHAEADGGSADLHRPDHEELADAYEKLLALSNHPTGIRKVSVEEAKSQLWTQTCPKSAVTDRLLAPLADKGFISVVNASITVHRRTEGQIAAAEAEADDAMERLGIGFTDAELPDRTDEHKQLIKYQRAGLNAPLDLVGWVAGRTLWSDDGGVADV